MHYNILAVHARKTDFLAAAASYEVFVAWQENQPGLAFGWRVTTLTLDQFPSADDIRLVAAKGRSCHNKPAIQCLYRLMNPPAACVEARHQAHRIMLTISQYQLTLIFRALEKRGEWLAKQLRQPSRPDKAAISIELAELRALQNQLAAMDPDTSNVVLVAARKESTT